MTISWDRKLFHKNSTNKHDNIPIKLGIVENYLNVITDIYEEPTTN